MKIKAVFLLIVWAQFLWLPLVSILFWKWNQQEITASLCINKNKPELECGGCCHLKKVIHNSINQQIPSEPTKKLVTNFKVYFVITSIGRFYIPKLFLEKNDNNFHPKYLKKFHVLFALLRPPNFQ